MYGKKNEESVVQVFSGTLWQAEVVKGLLDSNGIACALKDTTIGAITSPYAGFEGEVFVIVNEADEKRALEIIENNTVGSE